MTEPVSSADRRVPRDRRAPRPHPLAGALEQALNRGEVEVLFQPQFACADGALLGAEALVRWDHAEMGAVPGDELFLIAHGSSGRSELARGLTDHVLDTALAAAALWPAHLRLSLNVTAADLAAPGFVQQIEQALERAAFPAARLTLEITEQALVKDLEKIAAKLGPLVAHGVRVALDDFGAGFCNFRYLKLLPLHYLKLDRSMVEDVADDQRDLAVLRGIVAMAKALGLAVVAEGIESEGQRLVVAREGCASWQGFLGGKPMRAAQIGTLIAGAA